MTTSQSIADGYYWRNTAKPSNLFWNPDKITIMYPEIIYVCKHYDVFRHRVYRYTNLKKKKRSLEEWKTPIAFPSLKNTTVDFRAIEMIIFYVPVKSWTGTSQDLRLPIRCRYIASTSGAHKSFMLYGTPTRVKSAWNENNNDFFFNKKKKNSFNRFKRVF